MSSKTKKQIDAQLSDDSSEDVQVTKKAPAKKVADKKRRESNASEGSASVNLLKAKKAQAKAPAKKKNDSDDESEDSEPKKKPAAKNGKANKQSKKDSDDSDSEKVEVTKKGGKVSKKAADSDDSESEKVVQKKAPAKAVEVEEEDGHKEIFVRNLPWSATQDSLWEHFGQFGEVVNVKALTDKMTGKPKGLAFIEFGKRSDASKAIANPGEIDGRTPQCSFSNEKKEFTPRTGGQERQGGQGGRAPSNGHTIFVGNMNFKTNEGQVEKFFSRCGSVIGVRIAKHEDGKVKGFCHVDFENQESISKAIALNGEELDGRAVRIDNSEPRKPREDGGFRGGFGGGRGGFGGGRGGFGGGRGGGRGGFSKPAQVAAGKRTTFDSDNE